MVSILICGVSSGVVFIITRILPKSVFNAHRIRYKTFLIERNFYNLIRVRKWKNKIPELGRLSGLKKDKLLEPNNLQYLQKFLQENCIGESLHFFSILSGLLIFLFIPANYFLSVGVVIFLTNTLLHILPIFVQRYIRPKVVKIYDRLVFKKEIVEGFDLKNEEQIVNYKKA